MGLCQAGLNQITLAKEMPLSRKVEVFFHELHHMWTAGFSKVNDEVAALQAGTMMIDFMRHNSVMCQEILEELSKEE